MCVELVWPKFIRGSASPALVGFGAVQDVAGFDVDVASRATEVPRQLRSKSTRTCVVGFEREPDGVLV